MKISTLLPLSSDSFFSRYGLLMIVPILLVTNFTACQTFQAPEHSERIDLNKVVMTSKNPELKIVQIGTNRRKEKYIELDLRYAGSGINIIESIKSGEIWNHAIVVLDNTGKEIGREPINFQAFTLKTVETVTVEKDEQFVLSEDGSLFGKESEAKTKKSSHVDPNFQHKTYTDQDYIPQIIKLTETPSVGSYISVFIELTYVSPFIDSQCANKQDGTPDENCPKLKNRIFRKVHNRNELELERLQNAIRTKVFNPNEKSKTAVSSKGKTASSPVASKNKQQSSVTEESSATQVNEPNPDNIQDDSTVSRETDLKFRSLLSDKKYSSKMYSYSTDKEYCNSVADCRTEMKATIEEINSSEAYIRSVTPEGNKLYYREWNLVSSPKFFRVDSVLGEKPPEEKKPEKPKDEIIDLNEREKNENLPRIRMPKPVD